MEGGELKAIEAEAVQLIESHIDLSEALTEVSMLKIHQIINKKCSGGLSAFPYFSCCLWKAMKVLMVSKETIGLILST